MDETAGIVKRADREVWVVLRLARVPAPVEHNL
jgi:hypothetical protein